MADALNHVNGHQYVYRPSQNGIWDPQFIRNIILQSIQKLRPRNRVQWRFDILINFIVSISEIEENWLSIITILMGSMPNDPYTTTAILIIMRSIQGPDVATVTNLVTDRFHLSQRRAMAPVLDIEMEKNICIVLNCLAEKFVGYQSTLIFTDDLCSYLCHMFINSRYHNDAELQMRALLALEKFAVIRENKRMIVDKLAVLNNNHLSHLENFFTDTPADNGIWRELRYCARWTLDNNFSKMGRQLTYETVDMSNINVMLKNETENFYMKYSPDLMEIRNDTIWAQTLHGTCKVTGGTWYFEVTLVTKGSLIIGWGITGSNMIKTVGYEEFSIGYEGNKELMWYYKNAYVVGLGSWKEGDVLGCLLDITNKTITYFLNGNESTVTSDYFFAPTEDLKNFFPVITITPFQQCIVNLGNKSFRNPPAGIRFSTFNSVGQLTDQQKRNFGIPRRVTQVQEAVYNQSDDACVICCDRDADITLHPCGHHILCFACSIRITICPICRAYINERR